MKLAKSTYPSNPTRVLLSGEKVRAYGNGLRALFLPWAGRSPKKYLTPTTYVLPPGSYCITPDSKPPKGAKKI